ncbi:EAL domain-containing protein [Sphingomonas sp. AP4-R1]|uniref:bifunctional diguanylate cyclase/phosphodiesterase n=1 Tax=Sphingomonas sp. AP4-R1 TaxID=2735134 RepID=UPI0014933E05|nr:EAL domain-containing protein [Sphingomonas sp. AP4-R1]QJU59707.1 EAL domain-containing protein [Sphingomonas sp. AP4-R1]
MISVWQCAWHQHDWRLVLLAGLICGLACLGAVTILRQQRGENRRMDLRWQYVAGITTGFGIWCTHFVAMLGYNSGVAVVGYDLVLTTLSLACAIGMTTVGFAIVSRGGAAPAALITGAVVFGTGIGAMHYTGMNAMEFRGHFEWRPIRIALSILFGICFCTPGLMLALRQRDLGSGMAASGFLMTAVLALHFTGMTAMTAIPDPSEPQDSYFLSPLSLGLTIGAIALAVLLVGAGAAIINTAALSAIRTRGREFRIFVQGITDCALYMLDPDGHVVSWNAGATRLKGFTSAEAIGLNFASFYSAEDRDAGMPLRALAKARETGKFTAEGWRHRKDGSRFWANVTIETVLDEQGGIVGFAKITRDISRQKEDQDRLEALTAKLDAALTNMHQGLVLFDSADCVALVNARFRAMYRIAPDVPLEGMSFAEVMRFSLRARSGVEISEERVLLGAEWKSACLAQPDHGGLVTINYEDGSVVDVVYQALADGGFVATFEDVSERHRSAARIAHMAMHDSLTGLPNRINFNGQLDYAIEQARATGLKVGVVAIDLDGFKEINDTHGHATGDAVLQAIGERMAAIAGESECIARFGGDEFAAYRTFGDEAELMQFLDRLAQQIATPVAVDGLELRPAGSVGFAVFPDDGIERGHVLGNADLAMYRGKAARGGQVCRYEYGMDETARTRRAMAKDLREAIAREELSLAYQVQRSVTTGAITGYEALLRWHHNVDGWISPEQFIPVAEESGSIVEIGQWVLREACREAVRWSHPHRVAVNLSPVQFTDRDLTKMLAEILLETGLPPSRLELEITETAIIADKAAALHMLRQIKALGVTIAIDDFGTGYSSLETLHSFPFDKIKIDRSFVRQSDQSEQARAIIRAVIALGTSLNMPVLAEGVETEAQLTRLRLEGCNEAQGYLLGRPRFDVPQEPVAA